MSQQNNQDQFSFPQDAKKQARVDKIPRRYMKDPSLHHVLAKHPNQKLNDFSFGSGITFVKTCIPRERILELPKLVAKSCRIHKWEITCFELKLHGSDNWAQRDFLKPFAAGMDKAFPKLQKLRMKLLDGQESQGESSSSLSEAISSQFNVHFTNLRILCLEIGLSDISKNASKILTSKPFRHLPALRDFRLLLKPGNRKIIALPESKALRNLVRLKNITMIHRYDDNYDEIQFLMFILQSSRHILKCPNINLRFGEFYLSGRNFARNNDLDSVYFHITTPKFQFVVHFQKSLEQISFELKCRLYLDDPVYKISEQYPLIEWFVQSLNYRIENLIFDSNILRLSLQRNHCVVQDDSMENLSLFEKVQIGLGVIRIFT